MPFSDELCTGTRILSSKPSTRRSEFQASLNFEALEDRSLLAAQILTFDIDAARSFLALTGTLAAGGSTFAFESQAGGNSLVSSLDGSLEVELSENTIR